MIVNTVVKLEDQLSELEKAAWKSFKYVTTIFLENRNAEDDRDMVADILVIKGALVKFARICS
jgi:hypothetical protein